MFHIKQDINIEISLENVDGNVVLKMNDLEIGWFDEQGLNLLPDCSYGGKIPKTLLDKQGFFKVLKAT